MNSNHSLNFKNQDSKNEKKKIDKIKRIRRADLFSKKLFRDI